MPDSVLNASPKEEEPPLLGNEEEKEFEVNLEEQVGQGMEHIAAGKVSMYRSLHV